MGTWRKILFDCRLIVLTLVLQWSGGAALAQPPAVPSQVPTPELLAPAELQEPVLGGSKSYPRLEASGRVIGGVEWFREHPEPGETAARIRQPFFLKQARIKLKVRLSKMFLLSMSANLNSEPPIRSAYLNVRLDRSLQFRFGRFKRPVSRLELTGIADLPIINRGLTNDELIENAGWGDRALGTMVHGKFKSPKVRYWIAVMNAAPSVGKKLVERLSGVDVLARLQWAPVSGLSLGLNGGHKFLETRIGGPRLHMNAVGADVLIRAGGLRILVETLLAQNPDSPAVEGETNEDRTPWAQSATALVRYDWQASGAITVQPVVHIEWLDTDADYGEDESVRAVAGINILWNESLRLMPFVEVVRPVGTVSARSQLPYETYACALSLAF